MKKDDKLLEQYKKFAQQEVKDLRNDKDISNDSYLQISSLITRAKDGKTITNIREALLVLEHAREDTLKNNKDHKIRELINAAKTVEDINRINYEHFNK